MKAQRDLSRLLQDQRRREWCSPAPRQPSIWVRLWRWLVVRVLR